jgi:alanine dehydrogenase
MGKKDMKVGTVTEIKKNEFRVGLTPANVQDYIAHGHVVCVQAGAGLGSGFSDADYAAAGAEILADADAVWAACDMVVKVKEPLPAEYPRMRAGQIVYTYLHLAAARELTEELLKRGVSAIAYETITDDDGELPLLRPMSEVAGKLSVQMGARFLEKGQGGRGVLLGGAVGVPRGDVLILGAGVVGKAAMKMAIGLGANVTVANPSLDRLTYLDDVYSTNIQTITSTPAAVAEAVKHADLIICAALVPGAVAPVLIKREHLKTMRPGAVIVDVSVDQGGNCETTRMTYHDDPVYTVDGIIHYCVANMPGTVSRTSTIALTNATLGHGLALADLGVEAAAKRNVHLLNGINCYKGKLTCEAVAEAFDMEYTPPQNCW